MSAEITLVTSEQYEQARQDLLQSQEQMRQARPASQAAEREYMLAYTDCSLQRQAFQQLRIRDGRHS